MAVSVRVIQTKTKLKVMMTNIDEGNIGTKTKWSLGTVAHVTGRGRGEREGFRPFFFNAVCPPPSLLPLTMHAEQKSFIFMVPIHSQNPGNWIHRVVTVENFILIALFQSKIYYCGSCRYRNSFYCKLKKTLKLSERVQFFKIPIKCLVVILAGTGKQVLVSVTCHYWIS